MKLEDVGGGVYAPAIDATLRDEIAMKKSLERRGAGIVTTSSGLGTLLFAVATFGGTITGIHLDQGAEDYLIAGLVLFVLAAVGGLFVNRPGGYGAMLETKLQERVQPKHWTDPDPVEAARLIAEEQVLAILAARISNGWKALNLYIAITFQVLAVICLAGSISIQLESYVHIVIVVPVIVITALMALFTILKTGPVAQAQLKSLRTKPEPPPLEAGAGGSGTTADSSQA